MPDLNLHLNGTLVSCSVDDGEVLLETLRDRLGLRSVRSCCGIGVCGTCTVLLEGRPASSCLLLTEMVGERSLCTAENLDPDETVGRAFIESGAYQCSYCLPGMVLTITAALAEDPEARVDDLRSLLAGNLCRCGSYPQIIEALKRIVAAVQQRSQSPGEA